MSKNGFGLDASDWENCALRTAPASLQNFGQIQTGRHSAFCFSWELLGPSWGPPTIGQKMARSLESYVSGLIARSQRRREGKEGNRDAKKQQREEAQGSATDGLFLYIGAPFPARSARREAEIGAGALVVSSLGGFWACGPRFPPEGPKQRRREGKERQRGRQKQHREEAQGSATDGLFLYIGAPFPARGAQREAEIGAGALVVSSLGCFLACGPRSPPEGPRQRRRKGKERQRGRQKQHRGSQRECNRRAFPIYRGPVPGKGRPERSRDWSRSVGCL